MRRRHVTITGKSIFFDFDGVFVDSLAFHVLRMNEIFKIDVTEEIMRSIHQGSFHNAAPQELLMVDWKKYEKIIRDMLPEIVPNKGLPELLEYLVQNHSLHIVSSAGTSVINRYLARYGLSGYFGKVLGWDVDRSKSKKFESIASEGGFSLKHSVFVTDTLGDIREAHEVGVGKIVAVDFGYHDRATLEKGEPHHIISHLSELKTLLS